MDGIQEASHCSEGSVCSASVACTVALLGTLEELSRGAGLSADHIEAMERMTEPDNWMEMYNNSQGVHHILITKSYTYSRALN